MHTNGRDHRGIIRAFAKRATALALNEALVGGLQPAAARGMADFR